jgi:hypothetical protein
VMDHGVDRELEPPPRRPGDQPIRLLPTAEHAPQVKT